MGDGTADDLKGRTKEAAGALSGDDGLKREGKHFVADPQDWLRGAVTEQGRDNRPAIDCWRHRIRC